LNYQDQENEIYAASQKSQYKNKKEYQDDFKENLFISGGESENDEKPLNHEKK
jgi:hypothetical protein